VTAAAERSCTAGLAHARDAGDLRNLATQLLIMVRLDLQARRFEDAGRGLAWVLSG
jgi:hypothetical protein